MTEQCEAKFVSFKGHAGAWNSTEVPCLFEAGHPGEHKGYGVGPQSRGRWIREEKMAEKQASETKREAAVVSVNEETQPKISQEELFDRETLVFAIEEAFRQQHKYEYGAFIEPPTVESVLGKILITGDQLGVRNES